jgi:multidrug transporter EmrE-like cation transporter
MCLYASLRPRIRSHFLSTRRRFTNLKSFSAFSVFFLSSVLSLAKKVKNIETMSSREIWKLFASVVTCNGKKFFFDLWFDVIGLKENGSKDCLVYKARQSCNWFTDEIVLREKRLWDALKIVKSFLKAQEIEFKISSTFSMNFPGFEKGFFNSKHNVYFCVFMLV